MRKFLKLSTIALSTLTATAAAAGMSNAMAPNLPMASSLEMMPAATIVSEIPFQSFTVLGCNGSNTTCFKKFAVVPARERWLVQFVSCIADAAPDATFRHFSVQVVNPQATKLLGLHYLAPQYHGDGQANVYAASQPVQLTADAGELIYVVALSSGSMGGAQCGVSGTRQKLG